MRCNLSVLKVFLALVQDAQRLTLLPIEGVMHEKCQVPAPVRSSGWICEASLVLHLLFWIAPSELCVLALFSLLASTMAPPIFCLFLLHQEEGL